MKVIRSTVIAFVAAVVGVAALMSPVSAQSSSMDFGDMASDLFGSMSFDAASFGDVWSDQSASGAASTADYGFDFGAAGFDMASFSYGDFSSLYETTAAGAAATADEFGDMKQNADGSCSRSARIGSGGSASAVAARLRSRLGNMSTSGGTVNVRVTGCHVRGRMLQGRHDLWMALAASVLVAGQLTGALGGIIPIVLATFGISMRGPFQMAIASCVAGLVGVAMFKAVMRGEAAADTAWKAVLGCVGNAGNGLIGDWSVTKGRQIGEAILRRAWARNLVARVQNSVRAWAFTQAQAAMAIGRMNRLQAARNGRLPV